MTKFKMIGAAAILASALGSPAMAQKVISNPGACAPFDTDCQNKVSYQRQVGRNQTYRHDRNWRNSYNRDRGLEPAELAAGVVGGAVGTAAAIATAPIGGEEYARRNGWVCTPGTWFRGVDGRRHPCQ